MSFYIPKPDVDRVVVTQTLLDGHTSQNIYTASEGDAKFSRCCAEVDAGFISKVEICGKGWKREYCKK